jgi:DNA polymerase-3 subunit alpha
VPADRHHHERPQADALRQSTQFFMKSPAEMWELFRDFPEALKNTTLIAERCNVELKLGNEGACTSPPTTCRTRATDAEGVPDQAGAPRACRSATDHRPRRSPAQRGGEEGLERFMLRAGHHRAHRLHQLLPGGVGLHPPRPGQGHPGGSRPRLRRRQHPGLRLGITGIDPLRYNLIFERFLNPDRVSPPDFDIDFCQCPARRGDRLRQKQVRHSTTAPRSSPSARWAPRR